MGGSSSFPIPGGGTCGYHVLRVQEGSPGYHAGLEAFFDFIISIGDVRLEEDNDTIKEILLKNKDIPVKCAVYSSKTQICREVVLTPNSNWGGQGLLGVSIRYCSFDGANENVWHVLDVEPNSPAALAGLIPFTDYIIGSDAVLNGRDDFYDLIENADGQSVKLYVYNVSSDSCREIRLCPNSKWGGTGLLGCDIGYGYLHRIPTNDPDLVQSTSASGKEQQPEPPVSNVPQQTAISKHESVGFAPSYSESPERPSSTFSDVPLTAPTLSSSHLVNTNTTNTMYPPPPAYTLAPPAPLPAGIPQPNPNINGHSPPVGIGNPSTNPVPVYPEAVPKPIHSYFPSDQAHPTYFTPNGDQPSQANPTAVISLPGLPPLGVSMPPLSDLHINSPQSQ